MKNNLLEVKDFSVHFDYYETSFNKNVLLPVNKVNLSIGEGEIVAIVGASGSGKSLLAHGLFDILPPNAQIDGEIIYKNEPLTAQRKKRIRGQEICLIPQSIDYLDPLLKIKKQLSISKLDEERLFELLGELGLEQEVLELYPYQLSGGMARRILFSTAVLTSAKLIVADEPTPGMHLQQAVAALSILKELVKNEGRSVLLITHDIDLALEFSDKVIFFYKGTTIDAMKPQTFADGPTADWHPFTKKMWQALPQNGFIA